MVVRVFIMKIIKFVILYIISFYSFGFSAEKTILECNYISGTKETNIKDLKSYKPYITKRILEIDVDKGTLVDVNLVYNLKAKSPGRLSFEYKGNYNTSNENVDPLMNFTSLYNIDRINLDTSYFEVSNALDDMKVNLITISINYDCNKVDQQL